MTPRPRSRSTVPVTCDCGRHAHGSASMYQDHRCGCTPCSDACSAYRAGHRSYSGRPAAPAPAEVPVGAVRVRGQFVATFPYLGGRSPQRLRREVRWPFLELAQREGVELLPGEPVIRIDRTGAGEFVVVSQAAVSRRDPVEVRRRAAEMAYEHEQAHPRLAEWITKHLEGAA